MDGIWENNEEYNPDKERKVLIVFDDMIADMHSNQKPNPVVIELFVRDKKTKHFSCFYHKNLIFCTKKYQTKVCILI